MARKTQLNIEVTHVLMLHLIVYYLRYLWFRVKEYMYYRAIYLCKVIYDQTISRTVAIMAENT